jgi:hypothetical protein
MAMRELVDSRKALTGTPNAEPGLLAFLFGSYNSQLTTLCRVASYRRFFIAMPRRPFASPDEFGVGRLALMAASIP